MIRGGSYYVEPDKPINPAGDLYTPAVTPGVTEAANEGMIRGASYYVEPGSPINPAGDIYNPSTDVYIPASNNAALIDSDTVENEDSVWGQYDRYMQTIKEISEANTAKSIELAEKQNAWQSNQNRIAMDFNAVEAQKQRDWQEYLSNTAHQREVSDLIAAGLNPVLSAQGAGAPIGSGAVAQGLTSAGARGSVDNTYALAAMNLLNNTMDYVSRMATSMNSAARADAYLKGRMYAADMQYKIAQDFPGNGYRLFDSVMNDIADSAGYSSWSKMIASLFNTNISRPPQYSGAR